MFSFPSEMHHTMERMEVDPIFPDEGKLVLVVVCLEVKASKG